MKIIIFILCWIFAFFVLSAFLGLLIWITESELSVPFLILGAVSGVVYYYLKSLKS